MGLGPYIVLAAGLFAIGLGGLALRRNLIVHLMCLELMLGAGVLVLVAANRAWPENVHGQVFALFVVAVAAAEAAVGLALVLSLFRHKRAVAMEEACTLRDEPLPDAA